jgi:CO/xanthine dehydrogenase Mo-binding subunit
MNTAFSKDPGMETQVLADRLDSRIRTLTETSERRPGPFQVIGQSPEWRQVLRKAAQVPVTDTTVFLQGESGTGKEVVAQMTGGSISVPHSFQQYRELGAKVRAMLVVTAAERWRVTPDECRTANSVVYGPANQSARYAELASVDLTRLDHVP